MLKFVSQMDKNENTTPEFFDLSDSNRLCQSVINLLKELEQCKANVKIFFMVD